MQFSTPEPDREEKASLPKTILEEKTSNYLIREKNKKIRSNLAIT